MTPGPQDNRPGSGPPPPPTPPPREVRPLVFTPEILAEAEAASATLPEPYWSAVAGFWFSVPHSSEREIVGRSVALAS